MTFFDANLMAGRPRRLTDPVSRDDRAPGALLDEFGLAEALVWHIEGKEVEPNWGNQRVLEVTRADPRLHPVWTALPPSTGETPPPAEFCRLMREQGVRAAILFPRTHSWSLEDWCAGPLVSEFEARRVPILLDQDEADWSEIAALLDAHPDLRVVLIGGSYRADRFLFPLFARHRHLYVEISGYQQHRGLEAAAAAGFADHLLFGSRAPSYTPASALATVHYAAVSETDRAKIAGETLRALLAESNP
jgi:predicted TIM-barrel fold metal-dependent hydrolase